MPGYKDPPKSGQFAPGKSGNPKGKPKGIKSWSTLVQELLDDSKLADKLLSKKPGWWDQLPGKNAGHAIIVAMMISAMGGDVKAATWLRRTGYGDKLELGSGDGDEYVPIPVFNMRTGQEMMIVPKLQPKAPKPTKAKKKSTTLKKSSKVVDKPEHHKSKSAKPTAPKKAKSVTVKAKKPATKKAK